MDKKMNVINLDINDILPNRFQPRIKFNEESLNELADSIREHGLIQPIVVRPISDKYEIIAGERRYKACVLADLREIPAIILDINDKDSIEIALIENLQRRDLTPIEEAVSYKKTLDMGFITQEQLASKLGKSQSSIANKIRLLNLSDDVQEALMEEKISERHARSLLKVKNKTNQISLLKKIIKERLTVRKLDELIEKEEYNFDEDKIVEDDSNIVVDSDRLDNEKSKIEKEKNKEDIDRIINNNDSSEKIEIDLTEIDDINNLNSIDSLLRNLRVDMNKEEKDDNMNNMQNINDPVNYNPVQSGNKTGGRFIGIDIDNIGEKNNTTSSLNNNLNSSVANNNHSTPSIFMSNKNINNPVQNAVNTDVNGTNADLNNIFNTKPNNFETQDKINSSNIIQPNIIVDDKPQDILLMEQQLSGQNNVNNNLNSETNIISSRNDTKNESSIFTSLMNNEINSGDIVDKETLNNFLDPTFIDGKKQENRSDTSRIDDMVFSKFLDSDFEGETTFNSINNIDLNKSNNNSESFNASSSIIQASNDNISDTNYDKMSLNNNISPDVNDSHTVNDNIIELKGKPDLLAPMESSNNMFSDNTSSIGNSEKIASPIDNANNQMNNDIELSEEKSSIDSSEENKNELVNSSSESTLASQFFVTASLPKENMSAPTTPIVDIPVIDNTNSVNIENKVNTGLSDNVLETSNLDNQNVNEEIKINDNAVNINENSGIEPIIITDYTKQYDPILPETNVSAPKIELKEIINMIRNLSNQIENLGYVIDTDEIDLESTYQIIFNITKKN